jgi:hypothetical protein
MAIIQTTLWDAAPGRTAEVITHMARAKQIHERLGGTVRALQVQVGGPTSLRLVYALRFADVSAYAALTSAAATDPEWLSFQQTVLGSPSPSATLVNNVVARELPGFEGPFTVTGKSVSVLAQIRVNPGGMEGVMSEFGVTKSIFEKLGASISVRQTIIGGENTGIIGVVTTYEDLNAFGNATDALLADAEYQAAIERRSRKDAPGTIVSRSMAVEIPI